MRWRAWFLGAVGFVALWVLASLAGCGTPSTVGAPQPGDQGSASVAPEAPVGSGSLVPPVVLEPSEPPETVHKPSDLINMWRVAANGESEDTWLRLEGSSYALWRPCGPIFGGWRASTTEFLASAPDGWVGPCETPGDIPWLTSTATYERTADGWLLLDESGTETATLRLDGIPPSHPDVWDALLEPPEITAELLAFMNDRPAPLAPHLRAATSQDLVGYWVPLDDFPTRPFVEFDAGPPRTWAGSDGCNGVGGVWRLGNGGWLLATSGPQTAIGCEGVPMSAWVSDAARAGFDGDELVLLDMSGAELGRLRRGSPA